MNVSESLRTMQATAPINLTGKSAVVEVVAVARICCRKISLHDLYPVHVADTMSPQTSAARDVGQHRARQ